MAVSDVADRADFGMPLCSDELWPFVYNWMMARADLLCRSVAFNGQARDSDIRARMDAIASEPESLSLAEAAAAGILRKHRPQGPAPLWMVREAASMGASAADLPDRLICMAEDFCILADEIERAGASE